MILEKPEEAERINNKLFEDKVIEVVKEKVTVEETDISHEEFTKLMK